MNELARRAGYMLLAGAYQLRIWLLEVQTVGIQTAIRICRR